MTMQAAIVDGALMFQTSAATEPSDTETITPVENQLRPGLEETDVSPGLPGFLTMFAIAVVVIFILLNMAKKLRRVGHSTGSSHRVTAVFDGDRPTRTAAPEQTAEQAAEQTGATSEGDAGQGTDQREN